LINYLDDILGDLRDLNHLMLNKEVFNVAKKPEIGSLMIFEIVKKQEKVNDLCLVENGENAHLKGIYIFCLFVYICF